MRLRLASKLIFFVLLSVLLTGCGSKEVAFWLDGSYKSPLTKEEENEQMYHEVIKNVSSGIDEALNDIGKDVSNLTSDSQEQAKTQITN